MNAEPLRNILVIRTDRIGDVLLTLPMVTALSACLPGARISILVRSYTKDLVEGFPDLSNVVLYDYGGEEKPFFELLSELRSQRFDAALVAYPRPRIALLLFLAGIPQRVGTAYRWYSFLFTRRVREHRKTSEKSEAEFNLSLVKALGCSDAKLVPPRLAIRDDERAKASELRRERGIPADEPLVILHPGSGGSAKNWPPERFAELAARLVQDGFRVAVTGSTEELELVKGIVQKAGTGVVAVAGGMSIRELAAFIQTGSVFVANSTGPLHVAAAVGTPVIGFYPPVRVMSPARWGPLTDRKEIFVPRREDCPLCRGGECRSNVCMEQIKVHHVVEAIHHLTISSKIETGTS